MISLLECVKRTQHFRDTLAVDDLYPESKPAKHIVGT